MRFKDKMLAGLSHDEQREQVAGMEEFAQQEAEAADAAPTPPDYNVFLTRREVEDAVRISSRTIDRLIYDCSFPEGVRVSPGRIMWRKSEVLEFLAGRRDWPVF